MDTPPAPPPPTPASPTVSAELRAVALPWGLTAILPLPLLMAADPAATGDLSCLYLGLASGLLATEFHRTAGPPQSLPAWTIRTRAVATALAVNVTLFITFGLAAGVRTHFPFPLMATLSALPALGLLPWLLRRVIPARIHPYLALVLASLIVFAAKLAACIVARLTYGPNYLELGYAAADWRTAKLMISLFWTLTTLLSLSLLLADRAAFPRPPTPVPLHPPHPESP